MLIEPTYTSKQYITTILCAGSIIAILSSALYFCLYWFLYVPYSFVFSLIYILPLIGSIITLYFFRIKYVWSNFRYCAAFGLSFLTGTLSALLFSIILFIAYYFGLESRITLYEMIDNEMLEQLMSPLAISISMFIINILLSFIFSLIFAIFAKRKIK